jgi:predicted transporter
MDMMSVLWQFGILAAILVFGIKVGLASGLANLSKKLLAIICVGYGGGVLLISAVASLYAEQLTQAIYSYNTIFYIIMALIMIIAGLITIREWKVHDHNTSTATSLAVIAPCPCCFGSIVASILIVAPTIGVGAFYLSWFAAAALVAVIIIAYFASNIVVRYTSKPYPIILGNFMLLLGAYFLLSAIVIPNIAGSLSKDFSDLTMSSPESIIAIVVMIIVLVAVGIFLNKRSKSLLD